MRILLRYVAIFAGAIILSWHGSPLNAAQLLNKTVAIVNGSPITEKEIDEQKAFIKQYQPNANAASQETVLKSLILDELMLQAGQRGGVDLNSDAVNQAVEYALQSGEVPPELAKNKQKLKKQIIINEVRQSLMMSAQATASEKEIKAQMQNLPPQVQQALPVHFHLETLVVPIQGAHSKRCATFWKVLNRCAFWRSKKKDLTLTHSEESTQRARAIAEQALLKAKEGLAFQSIALANKQKPAWKVESLSRTQDKLPLAYSEALVNLNPGDVAGPFEFYNGFHLIKLKEVQGPKMIHARHILLKGNLETDAETIKQKLASIRQECLSDPTSFSAAAETHSEDLDTVFKGGDLGWILPDTLSPPFAKALESLKPKEISLPFQTSSGWHIVQLLGKQFFTPAHPEWKRYVAKRLVEERKTLEAIEDLQNNLYRSAHIQWLDPSVKGLVLA